MMRKKILIPLMLCVLIVTLPVAVVNVVLMRSQHVYQEEIAKMVQKISAFSAKDLRYSSEIFDNNNTLMGYLGKEYRLNIPLSELSEDTIRVFLAAEDAHFYDHKGVSWKGMMRALIKNIQHRAFVEGGSTITQQTARHFFLHHKKHLSRKLKELAIAVALEHHLSKDDIVSIYLNQMYFGKGAYGIEAASQTYFHKSARDLALSEAAYLAAMLKAPSRLSSRPKEARRRQIYILKRTFEEGWITRKTYRQVVRSAKTPTVRKKTMLQGSYFMDALTGELRYYLPAHTLNNGLHINSTFSRKWQSTLDHRLKRRYQLLANLTSHSPQYFAKEVEVAGVVYDSSTGEVAALRGGKHYAKSMYNRALYTQRPMGHMVVPFLTLLMLTKGKRLYDRGPQPSEESYYGLAKDNRIYALAASVRDYGYGSLKGLFHMLGWDTKRQDLGLLLGEEPISPLKLAVLYGSLVQQKPPHTKPTFFRTIKHTHPESKVLISQPVGHKAVLPKADLFSDYAALIKQVYQRSDCSTAVFSVSQDRLNYWSVEIQGAMVIVGWIGTERGKVALPSLTAQQQQHFGNIGVTKSNQDKPCLPSFSYVLVNKRTQPKPHWVPFLPLHNTLSR
ncbi:MAG: transglycosylase domain-containing protein [Proteobacteria bacterium]|nr:transglycosylase domain-containing protein [Pseudomonadota bacterium]